MLYIEKEDCGGGPVITKAKVIVVTIMMTMMKMMMIIRMMMMTMMTMVIKIIKMLIRMPCPDIIMISIGNARLYSKSKIIYFDFFSD